MDKKNSFYGVKYKFPSRTDYFFFSEKLKEEKIESCIRRAMRKYEEAKLLQECLDMNKKPPTKFRIKNRACRHDIFLSN